MLELGFKAAPEQYPPNELLDYAVLAEQEGFDSVWASDHFHPWNDHGQAAFIWTWLGALGARTSRVRLGTEVTCPLIRYNPAIIAQAAATLGAMFPGRAFLSLGMGESLNETPVTGLWPGYHERHDRMEEALQLIYLLWSGEFIDFRGRYYQTTRAKLYTRPDQPIPLYLAARGPRSAELAGRHADGLITTSGEPLEHYVETLFPALRRGATASGRRYSEMPRIMEVKAVYADKREGVEAAMFWASAMLPVMYNYRIYDPRDAERYAHVIGTDIIEKQWIISKDPEEHVDRLRPYVEAGFTTLVVMSPGPEQDAFIRFYGREVLPRLRRLFGSWTAAA